MCELNRSRLASTISSTERGIESANVNKIRFGILKLKLVFKQLSSNFDKDLQSAARTGAAKRKQFVSILVLSLIHISEPTRPY